MRRAWARRALVVAAGLGGALLGCDGPPTQVTPPLDATVARPPPVVIVMIGDGMGTGQLDAASLYRHGATGKLFMQTLARHGEVRTGGPSGITDSAAAASVMATGVYTWNGRLGLDRAGGSVETSLERAKRQRWATGVVTTTSLPHATPAGFTAHNVWRGDYVGIATEQARHTRPQVMLGGGSAFFAAQGPASARSDRGVLADLAADGYAVVGDRAGLAAAVAAGAPRLFGAFAYDQMTYVTDRPVDTTEPDLREMTRAALYTLEDDPDGVFLMVEGGRIDHGGHANDLPRSIAETLAFDDTVALVTSWARGRGNVTLIVTADHECGGLEVVTPRPAGQYPEVRWRWGNHTNARVPVFAEGPGTELLDGAVVDHRWVYAISRARIDGAPVIVPGREPIPDGELGDLRHRAVTQAVASSFGVGQSQLDALWLDATADGLFVGVEGLFQWQANAVEVWIDVDPGAGTGLPAMAGALTDTTGQADAVLAASRLSAPTVPGFAFGADLALVTVGGADPHVEDRGGDAGLRGLRAPFGSAEELGWRAAAVNFGAVRGHGGPMTRVPGQGLEAFIPWRELYPDGVPVGARVALATVLVSTDGSATSNQALPPFASGTAPGGAITPLPGVVLYELDRDGDGVVDGDAPPTVLR